jgi:predicted O-methyltransferase YrrM
VPLGSRFKAQLNKWLEPLNIRIDSCTAERAEMTRLLLLEKAGHFSRPVFPVLAQFIGCDPAPLLEALESVKDATRRFSVAGRGDGYSYSNYYFTSPDADVAYALIRQLKPRRIIEVGSGNSTQLFREAITDGGLDTELVSIDPLPRKTVDAIADKVLKQRLEHISESYIREALDRNDVLFIDSSHEIRVGNDVVHLLLNIVPTLKKGVVIHLHDIFLPFEYPRQWVINNRWNWNEQYLVQAMLQGSDQFEVLWAGHFLQKTLPQFSNYFESKSHGVATSLWLRKIA